MMVGNISSWLILVDGARISSLSMANDRISLETINDDTLITIFGFLSIPSILALRQTSKRMANVSSFRIVWQNACISNVLSCGYPFPSLPLISLPDLEDSTRRGYYLGKKWLSDHQGLRRITVIDAHPSTCIETVRFAPGGTRLLTVSKGIWAVISAWDIAKDVIKIAEWSLNGAVFIAFAINRDPDSQATLAVSTKQGSSLKIRILSLRCGGSDNRFTFETIAIIDSPFRPVALQGDILAFSDSIADTVIWNWRNQRRAILRHAADKLLLLDKCVQVVFAYRCILVIRARSIHLFQQPILKSTEPAPLYGSLVYHSFGWVNDVSVSLSPKPGLVDIQEYPSHDPIFILVRSESDDPWTQEQHKMQFFSLEPNPLYNSLPPDNDTNAKISPYCFPPSLTAQVSSVHGALRCTDIKLEPYGTAIWVHPHNRAAGGLISSDVHLQAVPVPDTSAANERLVAAVFPGRLSPFEMNIKTKMLWTNELNDWNCMDYNENLGLVVLGSISGLVTILEL